MRSWRLQTLSPLLFRLSQRCVQALPARLLRIRPFGVYEIVLGKGCLKQQKPAGKSAAAQPACQQQPFQVRWVRSRDEALRLGTLATVENIAAWNGTSRGAVTVWQEDQPVAVAWIATETFGEGELGLHYRLHDDEVWLFAAVVSPSLRRQGLYQQLLRFLVAELSQRGMQRILLGVSLGNTPSQKAHARQDSRQLGKIFAAKCLGFVICKVHGQVRRVSKRAWAFGRPIELQVDRSEIEK